ncbi:hypothetical protein PR048_009359 [Dryococelus australis]|uniref:NADH:ubiquinone reductase (H(+)-translocating) n=1 Tax=Dryococelus australis TaxID=614101 RepID=A0ABQ9I0K9_9NEOP|nr:hypothetical protein PR048_009359 [Dryococelus australis]
MIARVHLILRVLSLGKTYSPSQQLSLQTPRSIIHAECAMKFICDKWLKTVSELCRLRVSGSNPLDFLEHANGYTLNKTGTPEMIKGGGQNSHIHQLARQALQRKLTQSEGIPPVDPATEPAPRQPLNKIRLMCGKADAMSNSQTSALQMTSRTGGIRLMGGLVISIVCICQNDLKSLIAYSSVFHIGFNFRWYFNTTGSSCSLLASSTNSLLLVILGLHAEQLDAERTENSHGGVLIPNRNCLRKSVMSAILGLRIFIYYTEPIMSVTIAIGNYATYQPFHQYHQDHPLHIVCMDFQHQPRHFPNLEWRITNDKSSLCNKPLHDQPETILIGFPPGEMCMCIEFTAAHWLRKDIEEVNVDICQGVDVMEFWEIRDGHVSLVHVCTTADVSTTTATADQLTLGRGPDQCRSTKNVPLHFSCPSATSGPRRYVAIRMFPVTSRPLGTTAIGGNMRGYRRHFILHHSDVHYVSGPCGQSWCAMWPQESSKGGE